MSSFEDIKIAVDYSYNSMTWITWLVLFILVYRTVVSFNTAYKGNSTYAQMISNKDKKAITQFYSGIILSILCIVVFFLPYILNYSN
jgi:heme/copper-type cytochrome/quinol oxidase subunit 2